MSRLEEGLRSLSRVPSPDLWPEIELRELGSFPRTFPWKRLSAAAVALTVAAAGTTLAIRAFLGEGDSRPSSSGRIPAATPLEPHVTETVEIGPQPLAVAAGEGAVWALVLFPDEPPHVRLVRIDPVTNQVVAETPVGASGEDLAVGLGSVWVSTYRRSEGPLLLRVDVSTNEVIAEITGAGGRPVVAHGSVWAVGTAKNGPPGTVVRVDPATNEVVAEISVPLEPPPFDIVAGETSVWALGFDPNGHPDGANLARIDPSTNAVAEAIDLDAHGTSMVAGGGYLWVPTWLHEFEAVATGSDDHSIEDRGIVARIDERTGEIVPVTIDAVPFRPFAYGEGGVWVLGWPREGLEGICRLNEVTFSVDVCVEPPSLARVYNDWAALEEATSTIWVINDRNTVTRIDLRPS